MNSGLTVEPGVCAGRLAALADPTRLAVLEYLLKRSGTVKQINEGLRLAQNLLSHHLKVLREAGLVISRRDGKGVRYELAPGVEIGASGSGINLGCCTLTFPGGQQGPNQDPPGS
jgi:DNA-binding transcriptional ArsR family regulator